MSLEQELKRDFECPYHRLSANLVYAFGWINDLYYHKLSKFGITTNQFNVLRILNGYYPNSATINELRECMPEKHSDTSRLVERLREKNYLERVIDPDDRRKAKVKITSKGKKLIEKIENEEENWLDLLRKLSQDEAEKLNELLDKLRDG